MNEDEALELFAPARERVMPAATFSMTEVYAADARRRRRRRSAAVAATVAVVIVIVAAFAVSGPGGGRALRPVTTPSTAPPSLAALLDQLQLPADARPTPEPADLHSPYEGQSGSQQQVRSWTTSLAPAAALAAMTGHPLAGVASQNSGQGTKGDLAYVTATWTTPETATVYGPEVDVEALQRTGGGSTISALAWQLNKPAKSADDLVAGRVDSVVGTVADVGGAHARRATVSGDQARRLAADINALWVDVAPPSAGCGAGPYATGLELDFHSSTGDSSFSDVCGVVAPVRNKAGVPGLEPSAALERDLATAFAFAALLPASTPSGPTSPAGPDDLVSLLDQVPVPSDAQRVSSTADDQLATAYGYSDQPGYEQAKRYWRTGSTPADAIAAMTARPPAGMTGGVEVRGPNKGPADAEASYRAADTADLIGPRLDLYAIALPAGGSAISALAWDIRTASKPAADRVTGTVSSVTATYDEGTASPRTTTVAGTKAGRLADAFNGLLVNASHAVPACAQAAATLTLTFHTSTGDRMVSDSCGFVTVLPASGTAPELKTSNAFNLDVNQDFVGLMPTPLPSSAPLPVGKPVGALSIGIIVSGGPAGTPNQDLVAGAVTVSAGGNRVGGGAVASGSRLLVRVTPDRY